MFASVYKNVEQQENLVEEYHEMIRRRKEKEAARKGESRNLQLYVFKSKGVIVVDRIFMDNSRVCSSIRCELDGKFDPNPYLEKNRYSEKKRGAVLSDRRLFYSRCIHNSYEKYSRDDLARKYFEYLRMRGRYWVRKEELRYVVRYYDPLVEYFEIFGEYTGDWGKFLTDLT